MGNNAEIVARGQAVLYPNYRPLPVSMQRGQGSTLFDAEGKAYLDMAAGVAVCGVGHAHPVLAKAIAEQAAELLHVSNYVYNTVNVELAEQLTRRSGYARALFCNSGGEANEAMLKLARHHFYGQGDTGRTRMVAFTHAFHGRTLGALSLTGTAKYREGFGVPGGVTHVAYGDLEAVRATMGPDVAAIVCEVVQGEGGVIAAPEGFLAGLRELADAHGALLLFDEVQTGIGRLGHFLGAEAFGVRADAVSLAKGLGGGFPIGALLTTEALAGALPPGTHGTTFGGNALACRAALAVLSILDDENLIAEVGRKGELLRDLLDELGVRFPRVVEGNRGLGLLRGLVLREGLLARDCLGLALEQGVLLTAAGERVLRFTPPLVVTDAELRRAVEAIAVVLAKLDEKLQPA